MEMCSCTGCTRCETSLNVNAVPSMLTVSPASSPLMIAIASVTASSGRSASMLAMYGRDPRPIERSTRPPESWSSVAAPWAMTAGFRWYGAITPMPILGVVVYTAARAAVVQTSHCENAASGTQIRSKPYES